MSINANVRYVGPGPSQAVALPAVDAPAHEPPLLDRAGDQIRDRSWLPLGGALLTGTAAAILGARSGAGLLGIATRALGGGVAGALAGIGAGIGIDLLLGRADPTPIDAPVANSEVRVEEDLRVMTYNVHGAMGPQGTYFTNEQELDRLAESIRREQPDVVLLQELDRFAIRSSHEETLVELAKRLGATGAAFTPRGTMVSGRQEGTGVLTFNGVEIADARGIRTEDQLGGGVLRRAKTAISGGIRGFRSTVLGHDVKDRGAPDYFPRVTSDAMLVTPAGNHVRVLSGHYNGNADRVDYQSHQLEPVAKLVGDWDGPTLWGADFNHRSRTETGARERELLGAAGLRDAFVAVGIKPGAPERASFGHVPRSDIDRIYASRHVDVDAVRVAPFPDGEPSPSDHHPVIADVRLVPDRTDRRSE